MRNYTSLRSRAIDHRRGHWCGRPMPDFASYCVPNTKEKKLAYEQGARLCGKIGSELVRVESAGWAEGLGLAILQQALNGKDVNKFAGYRILMGVLDTDRGELYLYSSPRASVLVGSNREGILARQFHSPLGHSSADLASGVEAPAPLFPE
jgi:hypothetical protein